ncbi:hypothetical protein SAMN05414139_10873 [Burkholderia sp. D7]|nr:hypothetical protein SAMN05414139_10873 [Burkholderia sp. D7]
MSTTDEGIAPAALVGVGERISQTRRVLESLQDDIRGWVRKRELSDKNWQYVTQLGTLQTQLEYLLAKIEEQVRAVRATEGERSVYAALRVIDRRLIWIRRLWTYFQSKFDQRLDESLAPALLAADEIVWSCFVQPFRQAGATELPAVPLPFVALAYSPYAIPRDEPPQELRSDVDAEFLKAMLKQIPIPVTGFPPLAVDEPWWLAYLAHEIGHHVQFDFDGGSLLPAFADMLGAAGGTRWRGWGTELFADYFSLLMIGPWALWALAELVWSTPAAMLDDSNPRYPCALVRLRFMEQAANALGLKGTASLRGLVAGDLLNSGPVTMRGRDLREAARDDLKSADNVAQAVVQAQYGPFGTLQTLCKFSSQDFDPGGTVALWSKALRGEGAMMRKGSLESARLVLGAGVGAWAMTREIADPAKRAERRLSLKSALIEAIRASREDIVRAAQTPSRADLETSNERLAGLLLGDVPGSGR